MPPFNTAYTTVFPTGRLTLGLMTPLAHDGKTAQLDTALKHAALADKLGFAALWTRDVPLMIPQGSDNSISALDDPFLWLAAMAGATKNIAVGAAAIVLPLRHPLHIAKSALTLNRISGGRFILGLGSGDRPEEFASFGKDLEARRDAFREGWPTIRAALSPDSKQRQALLQLTGGYDLMDAPTAQIPMIVVGSARQSIQWIAEHGDAWATYHRLEDRQRGRVNLWQGGLKQSAGGAYKPFIQSMQLDLVDSPSFSPEPIDLGMRTGRVALIEYLHRMKELGVAHVIINLARETRPVADVLKEIGDEVIPRIC